ncbi:hypothetical protein ElyMa_002105700 [Elysia marginata]|uniref:WSC domain-containing protein n=1 Tax=Elysia marginata TaxID=1093978 RepID=A0AAV4FI08_9GAST|nr:hypothetical protein ElyMa_002105700 [Elysia marginata]
MGFVPVLVLSLACVAVTLVNAMIGDGTIDHRHIGVPQGCYNSRGDLVGNALPYTSLANHRDGHGNDILWDMWNCTADGTQIIFEFCGKEAVARKKEYFGVEFYGECYFGNADELSLGQGLVQLDQCEERCKWDVGGPHTMMIYKVEDVLGGYTCSNKYGRL